jgi:CheY-like chemotaxis protein
VQEAGRQQLTEATPEATALIHDLNNTLGTVVGFSDLLVEKPDLLDDRETTLRYLEAIRTAGREASQVLNRLQAEWFPGDAPTTFGNPISIVAAELLPNQVVAWRELSILVIDDDERVRSVMADCLIGEGHRVDVAESGDQGLAKLRMRHFDLVITDRAMPGIDGHQVASEVRRLAPDTAVIMLTGFGETIKSTDQKPAGVDLVVSKPLTLNELRQALATVRR